MKMSISETMKLKGVKLAKATQFVASLELVKRLSYQQMLAGDVIAGPQALIKWLRCSIGSSRQECLVVVFLDVHNRVRGYRKVFQGSIDRVAIQPRDIFSWAIREEAAKIIMAHNHPSQNVTPSAEDQRVTVDIASLGTVMNIPLIDHLIVSYDSYYSFKEHNRL